MQSKIHSITEVICGTLIGYLVAVFTQKMIFPIYGIQVSSIQNYEIAAVFTAVSLVRGYAVRRVFNLIGVNK